MGLKKLFVDIPALVDSGVSTDQIECEYLFHRKNNGPSSVVEVAEFASYCRQCKDAFCVTACPKEALEHLLSAACSAASVRRKYRYRLLMAKLCLKANRPDLARPIVEELHSLIEELQLERWESPLWIAEVIDSLYQCLTSETASEQDTAKAQELFHKLCTIDVTRAVTHT